MMIQKVFSVLIALTFALGLAIQPVYAEDYWAGTQEGAHPKTKSENHKRKSKKKGTRKAKKAKKAKKKGKKKHRRHRRK